MLAAEALVTLFNPNDEGESTFCLNVFPRFTSISEQLGTSLSNRNFRANMAGTLLRWNCNNFTDHQILSYLFGLGE